MSSLNSFCGGVLDGFFLQPQLCTLLSAPGFDLSGPRQWALMSSGLWLGLTSGDPGRRSEGGRTEVLARHPVSLPAKLPQAGCAAD